MKLSIKRTFAALLSVAMTLSLCVWASADYPADKKSGVEGDFTGKTVILHSNDVHGEIMGYAYIAALKTAFKDKGADVILADAGDFCQGDPAVSSSQGATAVAMMNAVGYDVATPGNHEFDFGYAQLMDNLKTAKFNMICANIFEGENEVWPATWTYEKDGLKIGFFGLDTPETQTKANPAKIQGLRILSQNDLHDCAQKQIDALREEGVDLVVALTHLGVDEESAHNGSRSIDLYAHTQGIDLIIDGHSHEVMTAGENGEPIQSTGTKFAHVGVVVIDNATKAIEERYLIPTKTYETVTEDGKEVEKVASELDKDAAVEAEAKEIIDEVSAVYGVVFAQSEVLLNGERAPGNRTEETNLGDLITDAMVWKVLKDNGIQDVDESHIIGITNGGGIRATVNPGDVTRKDLNTVLPFGNTVSVVYVTGEELLEALEASTAFTPESLGGYPQTVGIKFTLDTTRGYDEGDLYPASTYNKPNSIQRVTITDINGNAFDPAATYAVVTNDFCAAGGDTYYAFKNASSQFDTGIPLDEAVMEYVADALGGVISTAYETPRGDQTIIPLPADGKKTYAVSVNGGSGSGDYQEGATVSVSADVPEGKEFDKWTGADGLTFTEGDANSASAKFTMPGAYKTLTATFRDASSSTSPTSPDSGAKKGCYVATSVYGSYDCPQVWTLRRFRDNVLAETWYGRLFIRAYYAASPTAVQLFGDCEWFQNFFRDRLDKLVADLQADGFDSAPYQDTDW